MTFSIDLHDIRHNSIAKFTVSVKNGPGFSYNCIDLHRFSPPIRISE